jgi:hypothetical protein
MNKKEILYWCDSVENTWKPREDVPRGENPLLIPESFLATAIRYLRALCECQTSWRGMIDEDEIPDVPGLDMGKSQHILIRFSEVREKIEIILGGEPLKVDDESLQKIMNIIKEQEK